jgi:hypothetical protein
MKFLLITLLSIFASVAAQLAEAPEVVVYFLNEQAADDVCSATELTYISNAMIPDLDAALLANNFEAPVWEISDDDDERRKLTTSNCDYCRRYHSASLCRAMFNCRVRRQLRKLEESEDDNLGSELLEECEEEIVALSSDTNLSLNCRTALSGSTCYVDFV